jgi:hypothetical protein
MIAAYLSQLAVPLEAPGFGQEGCTRRHLIVGASDGIDSPLSRVEHVGVDGHRAASDDAIRALLAREGCL